MKSVIFDGNALKATQSKRPKLETFRAPLKYDPNRFVTFAQEDQAILQVRRASICGTDLHILSGGHDSAPPVILGHEFTGEIIEVGSNVRHVSVGQRVAVDPNIKCGYCDNCRVGMPNMCSNLTTLGIFCDGGFADFVRVPASQLYLLPDTISDDRSVFFEPISCILHALDKVKIKPTDRVLIFGGGPIGCYFTMLCALVCGEVVVSEPNDYRMEIARSVGATPGVNLEKNGFDLVIDACGIARVIPQMQDCAKLGGTVLTFGQQTQGEKVETEPTLANQKELITIGTYAASYSFAETIRVLADSRIPFEKLITHRFGLSDILEAFELMKRGECMEIIITPEGEK